MTKRIAILGSTGSIGKNALRVIDGLNSSLAARRSPPERNRYEVVALTAHSNVELLAQQARKYKPKFVCITNPDYFTPLKERLKTSDNRLQTTDDRRQNIKVLAGPESLIQIAELKEVDIVLSAIVGSAGLQAVLAAAKAGKRLAIANKEPLVIAGELLMKTVAENNAEILPIDSEHSAVFQALKAGDSSQVSRIILTTSGGPFRKLSAAELESVTLEQALAHPIWDMGPKITIDSATMMNKALEIIEAHWLFDVPTEKIEVLVHPESIIHSLVEFVDGSCIAQMSRPDMCLPIQYALTYPERLPGISKPLNLEEVGRLSFEKPNLKNFRALTLAYSIAKTAGTAPAVFNAANEQAVELFLQGKIRFVQILELVERCLDKHDVIQQPDMKQLLNADRWARKEVLLAN
jgi:1-deoxy-D-xylulose-5-phosphate reductoisomerase